MKQPVDWGAVYGLLITAGVGSWEYIDEHMTLPRFEDLRNYWLTSPPVHVSVASIAYGLGVLKPKGNSQKEAGRAAMAKDMADAGIVIPGVKRG